MFLPSWIGDSRLTQVISISYTGKRGKIWYRYQTASPESNGARPYDGILLMGPEQHGVGAVPFS